jgi:hypothetical protein
MGVRKMTIVVWADETLAVDSLATDGVAKWADNKVTLVERDGVEWLVTGVGVARYITALRNWFASGGHASDFPKQKSGDTQSFIAVPNNGGAILVYTNDPYPTEYFRGQTHVWGLGRECAMGALYMGATAEQAVEAACACVLGCGGEANVFHFATGGENNSTGTLH